MQENPPVNSRIGPESKDEMIKLGQDNLPHRALVRLILVRSVTRADQTAASHVIEHTSDADI